MRYLFAVLVVFALALLMGPSTRVGAGKAGCPVIREAIAAGCPGISDHMGDLTEGSLRHQQSDCTGAECPALNEAAGQHCPYLRGEAHQRDGATACPFSGKQKTDTDQSLRNGTKSLLKEV